MTGPRPHRRDWTARDESWLRANYQALGLAECALRLGRKENAVRIKARKLGVAGPPKRYQLTPALEADLRATYPNPRKGAVKDLCERHSVPREWVLRQAWALGLKVPRGQNGNGAWSEEELQVLYDHAHVSNGGVVKALQRHGYYRTEGAVAYRRWQERVTADQSGYYTASQAAELIGIRPETMASECRKKRCKATPHESPGAGHQSTYAWLVHEKALRRYIIQNPTMVRRDHVDLVWLIDLLANGGRS